MNTFRRNRVVMATIGSLGDLHPYIALALEMRKRYIEPVIATSEIYRQRIESLNIEFYPIRPAMPEPETPEYFQNDRRGRRSKPRRGIPLRQRSKQTKAAAFRRHRGLQLRAVWRTSATRSGRGPPRRRRYYRAINARGNSDDRRALCTRSERQRCTSRATRHLSHNRSQIITKPNE